MSDDEFDFDAVEVTEIGATTTLDPAAEAPMQFNDAEDAPVVVPGAPKSFADMSKDELIAELQKRDKATVLASKKAALKAKDDEDDRRRAAELAAAEAFEKMSPQEKALFKKKQEELARDADFKLSLELFGTGSAASAPVSVSIEAMQPRSTGEFNSFADAISKKITTYHAHAEYPAFVDNFLALCCKDVAAEVVRKINSDLLRLMDTKPKPAKNESAPAPAPTTRAPAAAAATGAVAKGNKAPVPVSTPAPAPPPASVVSAPTPVTSPPAAVVATPVAPVASFNPEDDFM